MQNHLMAYFSKKPVKKYLVYLAGFLEKFAFNFCQNNADFE